MSLLDLLRDEKTWREFIEYKSSLACPKDRVRELEAFVARKGYLPVCERIAAGEKFPIPKKSVISKMSTQKKRVVYTYPYDENTVLKLLTYLMLRRYDGIFEDSLFSFRPGRSAKDAVRRLIRTPGIRQMFSYKVDVSDYFNSVPVEKLLPELETVTADDPRLYSFLAGLLTEKYVRDGCLVIEEKKGIMAGTPLASFYANLYLDDLDRRFTEKGIPYCRYSDDIILFAPTREEAEAHATDLRGALGEKGLAVNPKKESFTSPEEGWVFLGFSVRGGVIDVAPATVEKLKGKMRRKTAALSRWKKRNGMTGENAAAAFIRVFNRKLLEDPHDNDLSWCCWFFSVINTAESLAVIDRYAQDCIRYLVSGKRTKSRFNVRYEDMKALGYRSLVNAYYAFGKEE